MPPGVDESGNCVTVHPWLVEQVTKGNTFPLLSNANPPDTPVPIPEYSPGAVRRMVTFCEREGPCCGCTMAVAGPGARPSGITPSRKSGPAAVNSTGRVRPVSSFTCILTPASVAVGVADDWVVSVRVKV